MKFESLTRDGIGYEYDKGYEVYVRHNPIADENLYEFQTYNDGMVQHSNRYAVPAEHALDCLASWGKYLLDHPELINKDDVDYYKFSEMTNRKEVQFYMKMKYDPDKPRQFYNASTFKLSRAESKRHDKRWEEVPHWADGSLETVYGFICKSYFDFIARVRLMDEVREMVYSISGFYVAVDTEKYFQTDRDGFNNLRTAVNVIEKIHESIRALDRAARSLEGLDNNWISRQNFQKAA